MCLRDIPFFPALITLLTQAKPMLEAWTAANGWFDLEKRLVKCARVDYNSYAMIDKAMLAVRGTCTRTCKHTYV